MEFSVDSNDLKDALSNIKDVYGSSSLAVLSNFKVTCKNNKLKVVGTDLDNFVTTYCDCHSIENGEALIPFSDIYDLAKNSDEHLKFEEKTTRIHIKSDNSTVKVHAGELKDFPEIPETPDSKENLSRVYSDEIKNMLGKVKHNFGNSDRRDLDSAYLEKVEDKFRVVSTDGVRLAKIERPVEEVFESNGVLEKFKEGVIVPSDSAKLIHGLIDSSNGDIYVGFEGDRIIVFHGDSVVISQIIESNYPDYKQSIPDDYENNAFLNTNDLKSTLDLAKMFTSKENSNAVDFNVDGEKLLVHADDPNFGEIDDSVFCDSSTEFDGTISANIKYVQDVLDCISGETKISFNGSLNPIIFEDSMSKHDLYVVMPLNNSS